MMPIPSSSSALPAWLGRRRNPWVRGFFPIVPGAEEQSWQNLSEVFFPAFMRGESAFIDRDSRSFMRMMLDDIESTIASDA